MGPDKTRIYESEWYDVLRLLRGEVFEEVQGHSSAYQIKSAHVNQKLRQTRNGKSGSRPCKTPGSTENTTLARVHVRVFLLCILRDENSERKRPKH